MFYGLQVDTVATLVTVWTLATAALILRLAARRMTRMPLWLDDFACLAAYLLGAAYNAWEIVCERDLISTTADPPQRATPPPLLAEKA